MAWDLSFLSLVLPVGLLAMGSCGDMLPAVEVPQFLPPKICNGGKGGKVMWSWMCTFLPHFLKHLSFFPALFQVTMHPPFLPSLRLLTVSLLLVLSWQLLHYSFLLLHHLFALFLLAIFLSLLTIHSFYFFTKFFSSTPVPSLLPALPSMLLTLMASAGFGPLQASSSK